MRKLCIVLILPILFAFQSSSTVSSTVNWGYSLEVAKKRAKKQNKNILVYFTGSDWCPPCKMLKKDLFETEEFKTASENYVLVYVDIPRNQDLLSPAQYKQNKAIVAEYNKKGVFPMLTVLDSKGKAIDEYSGYAMNGDVSYHMKLIRKHN